MYQFIQKITLISSVLMLLFVHGVLGIHETRVIVTNSLKGNLDLTLHCRSGGPGVNDLGVQVLKPGANFGWRIGFEITDRYYFCKFVWKSEVHSYFIYRVDRDTCTTCNWYITQSGPCTGNFPYHATCHSWNN